MKKTLIAAAALTAMAASAMAADVTLYGVADAGIKFVNTKTTGASGSTTNSTTMAPGIAGGNKWGIKGTEKLHKNYSVSFLVEGGYTLDDGNIGQGGRIFGRQAQLSVTGPCGTLSFGRMGTITDDTNGGFMHGMMGGFGSSYSGLGSSTDIFALSASGDRVDNAVRYDSPKFAGFQVSLQYSDCADTVAKTDATIEDGELVAAAAKQTEGTAKSVSYSGATLRYTNGAFDVAVGASGSHAGKAYLADNALASKDSDLFNVVVDYNFGPAKMYLTYQHVSDVAFAEGIDQDAAQIAADFNNVFGGKLMTSLGYSKKDGAAADTKTFRIGAVYKYDLSKRTFFFAGAGYKEAKVDPKKTKTTTVAAGLHHSF